MMWWWSLFHFCPLRSILVFALFIAFDCSPCAARVVINEVYYDHPGRDEGWEFVELYNAADEPFDLSGWRLEALDGASGRKSILWTAPEGTRIKAREFVSVAGSGRNPAPGLLLRGALGNGPDAVRLVSPAGTVDLVGYGQCAFPDLYESLPAPDVASGLSLARKPDGFDSNRNDADFVAALPTSGRRNYFLRDVGLAVSAESVLPCRGSRFSLKLDLINRGLDIFNGHISIVSTTTVDGLIASSERLELDLALAASAVDSLPMTFSAPYASRFEIRIAMSDAPDENPANDTAAVFIRSSPGEVVINEIMYRPDEGMSEWVELRNCAAYGIDLKGWMMSDATGTKRIVATGDLDLPAGGYMILAKDSAAFEKEFPACGAPIRSLAGGWPSLNDTDRGVYADMVKLYDADSLLVERILYRDLLGSEKGRSIERVSETICSALRGGVWHRCPARGGSTPGEPNAGRAETTPGRGEMIISPNPFGFRRDGETVITGTLAEGETGFLVRIFSVDGVEIRRIAGENGGARVFSCRWDGRRDDGSPARPGLYLCLVEFVRMGGGVCRKEKKCIAVAGE